MDRSHMRPVTAYILAGVMFAASGALLADMVLYAKPKETEPRPETTLTCGPPPPRLEADGCKVFRVEWTPECDLVLICDKARIVIYRIPRGQAAPKTGGKVT